MGGSISAPINEAVNFLNQLAPEELARLRTEFPDLDVELNLGKQGGESSGSSFELDISRAKVMVAALELYKTKVETQLSNVRKRIDTARGLRLLSQIFSLICSSGVLAAIALKQQEMTIFASVLTLISSIGTLFAEHREKLIAGKGNIYEAFESAGKTAFHAGSLSAELSLRVANMAKGDDGKLVELIAAGNGVCAELNSWVQSLQ
jgi:hypothetical protein